MTPPFIDFELYYGIILESSFLSAGTCQAVSQPTTAAPRMPFDKLPLRVDGPDYIYG
jgi:hypothetical protein